MITNETKIPPVSAKRASNPAQRVISRTAEGKGSLLGAAPPTVAGAPLVGPTPKGKDPLVTWPSTEERTCQEIV